jgi:PAS domain S-box-containing protein
MAGGTVKLGIPNSEVIARLPWFVRFFFGCCMASGAVALTSAIGPLRQFPLLLSFPTVILAAWFLGMWGATGCALMEVALVDAFLTRTQFRFATGNASQELRLFVFVVITLLLGWSMRRLSRQKAEMASLELKRQLERAETERQLAEQRTVASEQLRYRDDVLQIALNASGMGLWAWDLEKEVVYRSDEVYRIVGCVPGEFGTEPNAWLDFVLPEDVPALDEAFAKVRAEGAEYHMHYRVRRRDGSIRWIESQGRVQRNADGKVVRVTGVMADVTQRRQADEGMLRAEKLAVAGRLAASVAHEINNPLEAVANMLYLITISESAEQARIQASSALDELMRVSLVAQSTLKFHRETGSPRITLLSEVLESVLTMFRGKLQTMGIAVKVDAEREFPIVCMPSETQQIFANFIANSIEAMQMNGRIAIRLRPSRDWRYADVRGMRVTICDNGVGIDRASLSHIFEPFFTTKPETGTGLGLWVVAELVQRHRGSVHLRSSQKVGASGTVFSIFLPEGATDSQPDLLGEAGMTSSASSSGEPEDLPGVRQLDDRAVTT